jgi:hypothetical protein
LFSPLLVLMQQKAITLNRALLIWTKVTSVHNTTHSLHRNSLAISVLDNLTLQWCHDGCSTLPTQNCCVVHVTAAHYLQNMIFNTAVVACVTCTFSQNVHLIILAHIMHGISLTRNPRKYLSKFQWENIVTD